MNPAVSVVIPTYNRAALLADAVTSILRGTHTPLEILVVDDGSTDETRAMARVFGDTVRYFFQANRGPASARNVGIQNAHGAMLAFLDADDIWVPDALNLRVARMLEASAPPVQVVSGLTQRVTLAGHEPIGSPWAARLFGSALIQRAVFDQIGLLDESLQYGEDIDWFLRMQENNVPFVFLDQVTLLYRIHTNSLMSDTQRAKLYTLQVIKKSLARRTDPATGIVQPLAEMPDFQELLQLVRRT